MFRKTSGQPPQDPVPSRAPQSESGPANLLDLLDLDLLEGTFHLGMKVIDRVLGGEPAGRRPPQIALVTYQDAVSYFVNQHPGTPQIEMGALLRRPHARGHLLFQVFLDQHNRVCRKDNGDAYGRTVIAGRLDDELLGAFGTSDLILFR